jgi:hypothetical protein
VATHRRTPQEHIQVTTTSAPPAADTSPAGSAAPERPTPSRSTTVALTGYLVDRFTPRQVVVAAMGGFGVGTLGSGSRGVDSARS